LRKWVKLSTGILTDAKVGYLIDTIGPEVMLVLVGLMTLTDEGSLTLPEEVFAHQIHVTLEKLRVTLEALRRYGIVTEDEVSLANWEKYQSTMPNSGGSAPKSNAERQRRFRELQREKQNQSVSVVQNKPKGDEPVNPTNKRNVTVTPRNVTVTLHNALDIDIDKEYNNPPISPPSGGTEPQISQSEPRSRGNYGHVQLSDQDLADLRSKHGSDLANEAVEFLDAWLEEKPERRPKSHRRLQKHRMTIERWVLDAVMKHRQNQSGQRSWQNTSKVGIVKRKKYPEEDFDWERAKLIPEDFTSLLRKVHA